MKIGVLLVNLGTPDSFSVPDVRKYLRQFLMDGRVIDIPVVPRFMLVNGIIAPLRAPKSAKVYKSVWLKDGSPLKVYGLKLEEIVQNLLGDQFIVKLGMRYQSPSIEKGLESFKAANVAQIIAVPLFPQYASATNGSVFEEVTRVIQNWQTIPEVSFTSTFFDKDFFIQPIVNQIKEVYQAEKFDKILFTYHGLPERHIRKGDGSGKCISEGCCANFGAHNQFCYRAQCFQTTKIIAQKLGLEEDKYATTFQSRLGRDPWIKPYTDEVISSWPAKGIKTVLALSPSFVSDCLETTEEIGEEYKELFEKSGGEHWELLPCLNDNIEWSKGLANWIKEKSILPKQNTASLHQD